MKNTACITLLAFASFAIFGLTSCDKENTAISSSELSQPAQSDITANGTGVLSAADAESQFIKFGSRSEVIYSVDDTPGGNTIAGQEYELTGEGKGISPNYGECLVTSNILVDGHTGEANGMIYYNFVEEGITMMFSLSGNLQLEPGAQYVTLNSRLIPEQSENFSGGSGSGKTFVFGDLFSDLPYATQVKARMTTKARIQI